IVMLLALAVYYGDRLASEFWRGRLAGAFGGLCVWFAALLLLPIVQRAGQGPNSTQTYKRIQIGYEWACFLGFISALAAGGVSLLLIAYHGYLVALAPLPKLEVLGAALVLPLALTALSLVVGWERLIGRLLLAAAGLAWPLLLIVASF